MSRKLTDKEELFAQKVVELKNQSDAYRAAYNVSPTTKHESVNTNASKLMADAKIAQRVEEIRKELREANIITKSQIIGYHMKMVNAWEELWNLGKKKGKTKEEVQRFYLLKEMVKGSDYRGSLDAVAKMTGVNGVDKHEVVIKAHKTDWG